MHGMPGGATEAHDTSGTPLLPRNCALSGGVTSVKQPPDWWGALPRSVSLSRVAGAVSDSNAAVLFEDP